jgi:hypothetical protein
MLTARLARTMDDECRDAVPCAMCDSAAMDVHRPSAFRLPALSLALCERA